MIQALYYTPVPSPIIIFKVISFLFQKQSKLPHLFAIKANILALERNLKCSYGARQWRSMYNDVYNVIPLSGSISAFKVPFAVRYTAFIPLFIRFFFNSGKYFIPGVEP